MKKLFSSKYSPGAISAGMLLLRLGLGIYMMHHGYDKLVNFSKYQTEFYNFLGLGSTVSLSLVVFAEFFCSLFLILGMFTRLATIPLIITMCVVVFVTNKGHMFKAELPTLFLVGYFTLLFCGPGKVSVDGMIGK